MHNTELGTRLLARLEELEKFTYEGQHIPSHMIRDMAEYIEMRIPMGDFLYNIFSNDFIHAAAHADDINKKALLVYASYLYSRVPISCWGNTSTVNAWINGRKT